MANIKVCDICKSEGKLVEAKGRMTFRGHSGLNLDYCKEHQMTIPKEPVAFTKLSYKVHTGVEITTEKAREIMDNHF